MLEKKSLSNVSIELTAGRTAKAAKPQPDTPFRILVMDDFSGRNNRGIVEPLGGRRPRSVDCDNFDDVLGRTGVELKLASDVSQVNLRFTKLDDFHPDRIYDSVELFAGLKQIRARLLNLATFASAAAEIQSWAKTTPVSTPAKTSTKETENEMFQRLLGKEKTAAQPARLAVDINELLKELVAPHVVSVPDPQQAKLVAAVDTATSDQMRKILHNPNFQALEAAWRGLDFLARNLELDENLQLYLLDVSETELATDLTASENLSSTAIYKLLVEETVATPGGQPWAVVAGIYTFRQTRRDVKLLKRLAKISEQAGAPFIAAADYAAFTNEAGTKVDAEDKKLWEALRQIPEASYLGLALPRFLLRLPYGTETDPIERFDFEEIPVPPHHNRYLWGNPALACAYLLGQSFTQSGWEFSAGDILELSGLPVHVYKENDERKMTPCAEVWLIDDAAEDLLDHGLMPFSSIRGRDAIRLARFQALRDPLTALRGPWR